MRIVFCGSGLFGVPTLAAIHAAGHAVVRVYTQPSRPAGRGGRVRATSVSEAAVRMGLDVRECANINAPEVVEEIRSLAADVIVVVDFGQIMRAPVRQSATHGTINLHGSLLPALRGAAPVNWAVIQGLPVTGVTTFSLVDAVDAGDVYLRAETPISPRETAEELKVRLAEIGSDLMVRTLEELATGRARSWPQDHTYATPAPRLTKGDGAIDWSETAVAIHHRVHGTWRWPGGHSMFVGGRHTTPVTFHRVDAITRETLADSTLLVPARVCERMMESAAAVPPGTLLLTRPLLHTEWMVATGNGLLRVLEIQPAGKRVMTWQDFINGYRVTAGDRFVTLPTGTP